MSDQLRDAFESFRSDSIAQTQPPGIPAIRRTLARRSAARAAVLAVAAIVAIVVTFTWGVPNDGLAPTRPPVPSLMPPPASSTPGDRPSASVSPAHSKSLTPSKSSACAPWANHTASSLARATGPDTYVINNSLTAACPGVNLAIERIVYSGTGANASHLTRFDYITHYLSAGHRQTSLEELELPAGTCFTSLTVTMIGTDAPQTITNLVPALASSGNDGGVSDYFRNRGFVVITTAWSQPSC